MKYHYMFWGKVKEGKKRGRLLNFPTANISLHTHIPEGIYVSQTKVGQQLYPSITFIGAAKTFDEILYQAEIYILHFNKTIYGKWVTSYLLRKIRDNQKFSSEKELMKKMEEDKKTAEKFFSQS